MMQDGQEAGGRAGSLPRVEHVGESHQEEEEGANQ
jgi:hypothetical protein